MKLGVGIVPHDLRELAVPKSSSALLGRFC